MKWEKAVSASFCHWMDSGFPMVSMGMWNLPRSNTLRKDTKNWTLRFHRKVKGGMTEPCKIPGLILEVIFTCHHKDNGDLTK